MFRFVFIFALICSVRLLGGENHDCDSNCGWDTRLCSPCHKIWLPEGPPIFRHFLADPRQVTFSAGWRFKDRVFHEYTGPVSFGDHIAIVRWCNLFGYGGILQFEVEGCVWAIFKHTEESAPLVNADYYIAFPLTYCCGDFSYRFRVFHISSHIGDEFLLQNPQFDRKNASSEFVDFYVSYEPCRTFRVFGGIGAIVRNDESFQRKQLYLEYGGEALFPKYGFYNPCSCLMGEPYAGFHVRNAAEHRYKFDQTYVLGYQFGKRCGLERKVRVCAEYHKGFSAEGQFCCQKTNYYTARLSYGY